MPVRSLTSSVLRWPDADTVRRAAQRGRRLSPKRNRQSSPSATSVHTPAVTPASAATSTSS
jgi:hypothetical protein